MQLRRTIIFIFLSFLLVACSDARSIRYTDAPYLDFECNFADAAGCNPININKPIFIGLDDRIDTNCHTKLSQLKDDQLSANFMYSSWALTSTNGSIITGVFMHWVNYALTPVNTMNQQTYKVCGFIDLNENGQIDIQEPIGESLLALGENDFLPISNWSNY